MKDTPTTTSATTNSAGTPMPNHANGERRVLGYARVSTDDQELHLQIDALQRHGIPKS